MSAGPCRGEHGPHRRPAPALAPAGSGTRRSPLPQRVPGPNPPPSDVLSAIPPAPCPIPWSRSSPQHATERHRTHPLWVNLSCDWRICPSDQHKSITISSKRRERTTLPSGGIMAPTSVLGWADGARWPSGISERAQARCRWTATPRASRRRGPVRVAAEVCRGKTRLGLSRSAVCRELRSRRLLAGTVYRPKTCASGFALRGACMR